MSDQNTHPLDQFFTLSLDLFCQNDLDGNFLLVNPAFTDVLGYQPQELVGQPYAKVIHPDDQPRVAEALETVVRDGQIKHLNARIYDASGDIHWVEINAALGDGLIYVVARDITEQRRLHQQVADLAERLVNTLESITDAFFTLDTGWRFTFLNGEAERTLQRPAAELLGCSLWDAFPEALGSPFEAAYRNAMAERTPVQFDAYYSALDMWFDVRAYPSAEGLAVYFQDVTQRRFAENHMRILERSVEASVNGVVIVDALQPDMPIIYVNTAFELITGYDRQEAIGRNCRFLQGDNTEPSARETLRQGLADGRDTHVIIRNYRRDGRTFWNDLYISPVRDSAGVVSHFIGIQNDISSQREYQEQLAYNASHDALTGLPNRALLEDRLTQGNQIANRHGLYLAVLMVGLDAFKPINDGLGHDVGDQILVEVARRLAQQVRLGDTVARDEGDKFAVLLPDVAQQEDVIPVVERINAALAEAYTTSGHSLRITASIGIAITDGNSAHPQRLIQQSDLALHKAKLLGRNTYQWYTDDLNLHVGARISLRNDVQQAIEEGQFALHYQPQIHTPSGRIVCVEALLRWQHPQRGNVPPAEFIGLAEDTGQIIAISLWVIAQACRDGQIMNARSQTPIITSINISPLQFQRDDFVPTVMQALAAAGLAPALLELELTEGILMRHTGYAIAKLNLLREYGVRIAIDDFGTGFSSMSYLKHLPVNKIKIDQSFIKDLISDYRDAAIVQSIVSMAHNLGLQVIAEGVETSAQQAFLHKIQVEICQGYYLARPMPLENLNAFVETRQAVSESPPEDEHDGRTLLLFDEEPPILNALTRVFRHEGYRVLPAGSAPEAFELMATQTVQVVISGQIVPGGDGTTFLRQIRELHPGAMQIVLTGYTDLKAVTQAVNDGAVYKFLTKPWQDDELRQVVKQAFREAAK